MDLSDFELAAFFSFIAASIALLLGMAVTFEVKHRRSPVGRMAPQRWFGV